MDDLERLRIGLCLDCRYRRIVQGGRSIFYMCQRSFTDPDFPKYPRLPVIRCAGYDPSPPDPSSHSDKLTG